MTKVYIENYGCSANKSNAEIMAGLLEKAGCIVLTDEKAGKHADIVIVNTCIVKGPTENKAVRRIKQIAESGKNLIVSGCMPEAESSLVKEIAPDAILVGPQHVKDITKAVDIIVNKKKKKDFIGAQHEIKLCLPKHRYNKIIDIVQISEGCDGACAYCITRFAKGKLYSYPPEKIITEIRNSLEAGCKEIWLTSQDCASYEHGLADLLYDIANIPGRFFVRVGMMNPNHVLPILDELVEVFKQEKIFKFIHIPVQAGNDEVLKNMNRKYKVEDFRKIVKRFREAIPKITISIDIICGFPAETEEQFEDSVELIKEIKPDVLNISRFWSRPGTAAENMKQFPTRITKERSQKLTKVFHKVALEKNKAWIGWKGEVLIDEKGKLGTMVGRNYAYRPVILKKGKIGEFVDVDVKDVGVFDLRA